MLENLFVQSTNLKHSECSVQSYQDMTSSEKREDKNDYPVRFIVVDAHLIGLGVGVGGGYFHK